MLVSSEPDTNFVLSSVNDKDLMRP